MGNPTLEDQLVHEVWRQDTAAIRSLLSRGADPNRPGRAWSSAIACAGENDETGEVVRLLVGAGADINLQDARGVTPLHHAIGIAIDGAIQQGEATFDWAVVGVMLELGADPTIADLSGETPFDIASKYSADIQKSLKSYLRSRRTE